MSDEEIINNIIVEEEIKGVKFPKNFKTIVDFGFDSVQEFNGYSNDEDGIQFLLKHFNESYISKENIKKLNEIIQSIKIHMNYAPGGQGAQDAKESFDYHANLQSSIRGGRSIKTKRRRRIKRRRPTKRRPTKRRRPKKKDIQKEDK